MAGQGKLFQFFNLFGNYRHVFGNRSTTVTLGPCYLQNAGLKMTTKEKLKTLNLPKVPKRPPGPFFRYLVEQRPSLVKTHPEWKVVDIAKHCAVNWKDVAADIKEKYQEQYNKDLAVFEEINKKYKASLTPEQTEAISAAKKEKRKGKEKRKIKKLYRETDKPKRPKGSFIFFILEQWALPENKNKKLAEMLATGKDEWHSMSDEKKARYLKMQKEAIEKYNKEMAQWESKMLEQGNTDLLRKESRFIAASKDSHTEIPKKRQR